MSTIAGRTSSSFHQHLEAISAEYTSLSHELRRLQIKLDQQEGNTEEPSAKDIEITLQPAGTADTSVTEDHSDADFAGRERSRKFSQGASPFHRSQPSEYASENRSVRPSYMEKSSFFQKQFTAGVSSTFASENLEEKIEKEKARKKIRTTLMVSETKRAMLTHKMKAVEQELNVHRRSSIVTTQMFGVASGLVNLTNCIYIGIQTNAKVRREMDILLRNKSSDEKIWQIGDIVFAVAFLLELALRLAADRSAVFKGREKWWNLFDASVVVASWAEIGADISGVKRNNGISILKAVRAVRIIRCFRTQNHTSSIDRLLQNLKTMLFALSGSFASFISAIIVLVSVMYVFALLFMSGVIGYIVSDNKEMHVVQKLEDHFGSLERTLYSLIGTVTGGYDWSMIADPLQETGTVYGLFFVLYIIVVLCGILNILNGIFVSSAMQVVQMDQDYAIDGLIMQRESTVSAMIKLFVEADRDKSHTISREEFSLYLGNDRIKAYYMALGFDVADPGFIFDALDVDGDEQLELTEFVDGMIRLRSPAKLVDIKALDDTTASCRIYLESITEMMAKMDGRVKAIMQAFASLGASFENFNGAPHMVRDSNVTDVTPDDYLPSVHIHEDQVRDNQDASATRHRL